jgi:hypothetical protein
MKFKIPPSISIGGVEYDIIYTKDPPLFDKENDIANVAQIDFINSEIRIWLGLSDEMQLISFIHEIAHGVDFVLAIEPGDMTSHTEEHTETTANIWLQVIKQIVEWNLMCNTKSVFKEEPEKEYEVVGDFSIGGGGLF